ncbi:MAG TPA: SRPBCC domain-containing protein [Polyangiaceae bacterium]|nr:SRPBCC domain-containing protein [Polyangiaceae bacterium]
MKRCAMIPGDQAIITVLVAVEPALAFEVFTQEIDQWWRRGLRYRAAGTQRGIIHLEPGVGGRLFESFDTNQGARVVETGRVTIWEPPVRLVFEWRLVNFAPAEKTEVEVTFAPSASGTLVTVRHRGWGAIRSDHPARHGEDVPTFIRNMGMWWGDLLTSLREHTALRAPAASTTPG